jgi:hypothetical protein
LRRRSMPRGHRWWALYGNCFQCLKNVLKSDITRCLGVDFAQQQFSNTVQPAEPIENVAMATVLRTKMINYVAVNYLQRGGDALHFLVNTSEGSLDASQNDAKIGHQPADVVKAVEAEKQRLDVLQVGHQAVEGACNLPWRECPAGAADLGARFCSLAQSTPSYSPGFRATRAC